MESLLSIEILACSAWLQSYTYAWYNEPGINHQDGGNDDTLTVYVALCDSNPVSDGCAVVLLAGNRITAAEHESIFRADDVRTRLSILAGPLCAFGIVGGLAIILHAQAPGKAISGHFREARVYTSNKTNPVKGKNILRMLLLCAAIVFIMLGAMNGGAYDVLVKAINICTECIGLG